MIPANWVTAVLAVMTLALLYWQGKSLLGREEYSTRLGVLTICLAGLASLLQVLLFTGKLIFSNELHVAMTEGPFVSIALGVFLLGVSLAAAFGWLIAVTDGRIKWRAGLLILGMGLVIGIRAATRMLLLNPEDSKPLRVYSFDLLSPELFLWLALCILQTSLARSIHGHRRLRTFCVTVAIFMICRWAMMLPEFYDPTAASWWCIFSGLSLFLIVLMVGWWAVSRVRLRARPLRAFAYVSVFAGAVVSAVPAFILAHIFTLKQAVSAMGMNDTLLLATANALAELARWERYGLVVWVITIVFALALLSMVALRIPWRRFSFAGFRSLARDVWRFHRPLHLSRLRWHIKVRTSRFLRHWVLWAILILAFGGFFAASYLASTDPRFRLTGLAVGPGLDSSVAVSGLIFVWVLLIEIFGLGPLTGGQSASAEDARSSEASPARRQWQQLKEWLSRTTRGASTRMWALIVGVTSQAGKEKDGSDATAKPGLGGWVGGIVKTVFGVIILIAVSEIPNARQTLVETFHTPKFTDKETEEDVGQAISDEIINSVARIRRQLQPMVIGLPPSGTGQSQFRGVSPNDTASGASDALGKTNNLGLPGGVSLPLNLLLQPIQAPMRWLLGVRVIRGSLHQSDQGFTLLASSSDGETWDVPQVDAKDIRAAIPELADSMAFQIAIRDPSFEALGMGKKWEAFEKFESGQELWKEYLAKADLDILTKAVQAFREATEIDPDFALAYYRLGLSLQKNGDPGGAVAALRQSIQANSNFVPGYVALASVLQDFDSFHEGTAAVARNPHLSHEQQRAQRTEARELWQQVAAFPTRRLTLSDQATAYFGLCRDDLSAGRTELAYFYCKRAEQIFARLPVGLRDLPLNRQNEASAINNMGLALYQVLQNENGTWDWLCSEDTVDPGTLDFMGRAYERYWVGPHTRSAMQYFNLAREMQPDDQVIACNAALASYSLGETAAMRHLEDSPSARLYLGDSFDQLAKDGGDSAPAYYLLAMREYKAAKGLDPNRIWALNNFGYAFWQFRLAFPHAQMPSWLGTDIGHEAEDSARRAGNLAAERFIGSDKLNVESTLGEVLLGEARTEEAIQTIKALHPPENPIFDEVRWDLAQSYLCDSAQKGPHGKGDPEDQRLAADILDKIRQSAISRDDEQWFDSPGALDERNPLIACMRSPEDLPPGSGSRFVLKDGKPIYAAVTPCNWEGVSATVDIPKDLPPGSFQLRVWGAGVDEIVNLTESPGQVFLASKPVDTQRTYFAQLGVRPLPGESGSVSENPSLLFQPVSEIIPIPTHAWKEGAPCRQNSIMLSFVPQR